MYMGLTILGKGMVFFTLRSGHEGPEEE